MEWHVTFTTTGAYSEADQWWYGWVHTSGGDGYKPYSVVTENKKPLIKKEHGKFPSVDAACKFLSAYLILGVTDE